MSNNLLIDASVLNVKQIAEKWNADSDSVRSWCKQGFVPGAKKSDSFPFLWLIPSDAERPIDDMLIHEVLKQIVELQNSQIREIDLTAWGIPLKDTYQCVSRLAEAGYLSTTDTSTIKLTRKGVSFFCCHPSSNESRAAPVALLWTAEAAGKFGGSFIAAALN